MVVGEEVIFEALVEVPVGVGAIVKAEWDFDGAGDYPVVDALTEPSTGTGRSFATPSTLPARISGGAGVGSAPGQPPPTAELQEMLQDE